MTIERQQKEEEAYLSARFRIDPKRLEAQGRSLQVLLLHRRCASCWGELIQAPGQGMEIQASEHLKRIAKQCSTTPDFIRPEMPVMEVVFRILLGYGNQPTPLESIYGALREKWTDPSAPRTTSPATLHRMLASDTFYGITRE